MKSVSLKIIKVNNTNGIQKCDVSKERYRMLEKQMPFIQVIQCVL